MLSSSSTSKWPSRPPLKTLGLRYLTLVLTYHAVYLIICSAQLTHPVLLSVKAEDCRSVGLKKYYHEANGFFWSVDWKSGANHGLDERRIRGVLKIGIG